MKHQSGTATWLRSRAGAAQRGESLRRVDPGQYYQQAEDSLAQDVSAIPVYHYVRNHLVKPWAGASRRISWGITATPKMKVH
ncbi:hypothetical protein LNP74_25085 [Klebsiella pneumoniae subsp. pneumoniae]|nr:hypothetical protein [Klebsiella pneumoniae subsp. pneumoniae]